MYLIFVRVKSQNIKIQKMCYFKHMFVCVCAYIRMCIYIICFLLPGFVSFLFEQYPDIIDEAIDEARELVWLIKKLKVSKNPVTITCKDTAAIMMGKCDLSQRSYKALKGILIQNNVNIPTYDKVRGFCKAINVGPVSRIHSDNEEEMCPCMGYSCEIQDTLQRIMSCDELASKCVFTTTERSKRISYFLKNKNPALYKNFDFEKRTLFLRTTGDNFRACSRYPTEQTSVSLLNISELINCPYGQFITTLWRGSECRETLESH